MIRLLSPRFKGPDDPAPGRYLLAWVRGLPGSGRDRDRLFPAPSPQDAWEDAFRAFLDKHCLVDPLCLKSLIERMEVEIIRRVLERTFGNQKRAAAVLGIKYTTLNQKVKRYGLFPVPEAGSAVPGPKPRAIRPALTFSGEARTDSSASDHRPFPAPGRPREGPA